MTDIVERLRMHPGPADTVTVQFRTMVEQRHEAAETIERLCEEVAIWRSRYEAERQDHEATMKAWDEERSGL